MHKFLLLLLPLFLIISCERVEFPDDPNSPVIEYDSEAGDGCAPSYGIEVYQDGHVVYYATDMLVLSSGFWNTQISKADVRRLVQKILASEMFDDDYYEALAVDGKVGKFTYNWKDKSKTILFGGHAKKLTELESEICNIAQIHSALQSLRIEPNQLAKSLTERQLEIDSIEGQITFSRKVCTPSCVEYSLMVSSDGKVSYNGIAGVETIGVHDTLIDITAARTLISNIVRTLEADQSTAMPPEAAHTIEGLFPIVSVKTDSIEKAYRIPHHPPQRLAYLEMAIQKVVGTAEWVNLSTSCKSD